MSEQIPLPRVGTRVQFELSRNGTRFIGTVAQCMYYCGRPALRIERQDGGESIIYPDQLILPDPLRQPPSRGRA